MKFGKEFTAQMVQEWQEAYLDYNGLKHVLEDLSRYLQSQGASSSALTKKKSLQTAFSGLTAMSPRMKDDEAIIVGAIDEQGQDGSYQTVFLRLAEVGGEKEQFFFKQLDAEFNKVVRFYREKVEEVRAKSEELSRQMDALIALRIKVEHPNVDKLPESEVSSPSRGVPADGGHMEAIQEIDAGGEDEVKSYRPPSLQNLDHVKINVHPETPVSTLRNVMVSGSMSELLFSKEELRTAKEKLRRALMGFYQQLQMLKNYCFLNMLAVSKIMKKYDKITLRGASKLYMDMVDKSYLGSSDEVNKIIERVEGTFIKHFAKGNRRNGMKSLRPGNKEDKHTTTFFVGLFTGCSVAMVAGIYITIQAQNLLERKGRNQYMENIFPLYSLFLYIILHIIMYGTNTYMWRRFRVNYPFIFGFKPGTELGFREVFLVASGLSLLTLAAVLSHLDMDMDPGARSFRVVTELVPLMLVSVVILMTFCPFNIIYRSSRFFLLRCTWHCMWAPLYKVTLPDFFLADQLTSQVQALRSLQFYVCYYAWGDFKRRSNTCAQSDIYEVLIIVIAIIPFWSRALQCLRRLVEEKDRSQGWNCLKYLSTVAALVTRTMYDLNRGTLWRIFAASTSGITTIYNTYWDIVIDWGLLQKNSKNPWLRDKLLISKRAVYFVAIAVNILLRLVWMQLVLDFNEASFLHRRAIVAIVACLEILRRGIWNFFRVENEHFNNVGKYRAFKTVPLPFHYQDEEDL